MQDYSGNTYPRWRETPAPDPATDGALFGHPLTALTILHGDYPRSVGATIPSARFAPTTGLPEHLVPDIRYGAPRPISPREAQQLAGEEYGIRPGDGGWLCVSRGSDGGFHYRDTAYSEAAARGWCEEKTRALVRRILSGACRFTVTFDAARDRFYLA